MTDSFDAAVTKLSDLSELRGFCAALSDLRDGNKVARSGWNGTNQYLKIQFPDEHSKMTQPYIYIKTVNEDLVPWVASQTDLLAMDWYVVE